MYSDHDNIDSGYVDGLIRTPITIEMRAIKDIESTNGMQCSHDETEEQLEKSRFVVCVTYSNNNPLKSFVYSLWHWHWVTILFGAASEQH